MIVVSAVLLVVCLQSVSAQVQVSEKELIPVKTIPGTKLYTGIYYTLSMKSFPQGWITWVRRSPGIYDIVVELDPKELPKYEQGKEKEIDNQWTIVPSEIQGQYRLKNRRKPIGLLAYVSRTVGSGLHAAILEQPDDREKMLPKGPWYKDALWTFQADKVGKYYQVENVAKKGHKLRWSYTKYNEYNYFIQLASYKPDDDAMFLFTPTAINLSARVSEFTFEKEPQTLFKSSKYHKKTLAANVRFINNSSATLEKALNEEFETKDSATYSFTQSFSMMYKTSIEVSALFFKASSELSFSGGLQASQTKTKEQTHKIVVNDKITIPPFKEVEVSVYNERAENVVIPFKAKMLITGTAQRIVADNPGKTQNGQVPGDIIEAYIRATGTEDMAILKRTGNSILIAVSGTLSGNVGLKSTISTQEYPLNKNKS